MKKRYLFISLCAMMAALVPASAQILGYTQDFESMNPAADDDTSIGDDGWLVGANVFDVNFNYLYGYFAFPAPNNLSDGTGPEAAFSNIVATQGGIPQGVRQLAVFSDYNNGDHGNAQVLIESIVFREYTIAPSNVGETWTFQFDAKLWDATSANAFIKTLDGGNFGLIDYITLDSSAMSPLWDTYTISLPITQSLEGDIFQIGFSNIAGQYGPSTVYYDNVSLTAVPEPGTFALLGGIFVLGFVLYRRRRRS